MKKAQPKETTFTGIEIAFDWTNKDWAKTYLSRVRLAVRAAQQDEKGLEEAIRQYIADGTINELLEGWLETAEHFDALIDILNCVLARASIVLRKMGVEPNAMRKRRRSI